MTPRELKNSILQWAVQGKLVEQRPEEGTAEELYQQIQSEKKRLIREKKMKKEKPLPEIGEDEKPFEIPGSWKWVRLGDVFQHNTGKALNAADRAGTSLKYITTSNLYWDRFELDTLKEMFFTDSEIEKCTIKKGDLLVCEGGDIGRAAIWPFEYEMRIQNHIHRLRPYCEVNVAYFYYLFYLYKHAGWIGGKGIGIQGLSSKAIHKLVFPLPPLAEQNRIVAKIEELLPCIDRYEQAWSRLEELNRRFPVDMQKSILQMAVQGKLVEQRPEEGTAEELYQQIQTEKKRLIREGKIKKEKPLPEIAEDEVPFEIPESWKWVRLGEISHTNIGLTYSPKDVAENGVIVLRSCNIQEGKINYDDTVKVQMKIPDSKRCHIGDILICVRNGSKRLVGKAAVIDQEGMSFGAFMSIVQSLCNEYILYVINSTFFRNSMLGDTGTTTINQITQEMLKKAIVPLPPLAEQKRIVDRLEELLPLCEKLK